MRKLSVKQKKVLKSEYNKLIRNGVFAPTCDDLPYSVYRSVYETNMFENFDTDVDRFFSDLYLNQLVGNRGSL